MNTTEHPFEERILVPIALLRQHPSDAAIVLRIGSTTNAMLAMLRHYHRLGRPPDVSSTAPELRNSVDRLHLFLTAVAQLHEGIKVVRTGRRPWQLIRAGFDAGYAPPTMSSPPENQLDAIATTVEHLRNRLGSHVDPTVFKTWLQDTTDSVVVLWQCANSKFGEQVFLGAGRVALWEIWEKHDVAEVSRTTREVMAAMSAYVDLSTLAVAGFFVEHGLNVRDHFERRPLPVETEASAER